MRGGGRRYYFVASQSTRPLAMGQRHQTVISRGSRSRSQGTERQRDVWKGVTNHIKNNSNISV